MLFTCIFCCRCRTRITGCCSHVFSVAVVWQESQDAVHLYFLLQMFDRNHRMLFTCIFCCKCLTGITGCCSHVFSVAGVWQESQDVVHMYFLLQVFDKNHKMSFTCIFCCRCRTRIKGCCSNIFSVAGGWQESQDAVRHTHLRLQVLDKNHRILFTCIYCCRCLTRITGSCSHVFTVAGVWQESQDAVHVYFLLQLFDKDHKMPFITRSFFCLCLTGITGCCSHVFSVAGVWPESQDAIHMNLLLQMFDKNHRMLSTCIFCCRHLTRITRCRSSPCSPTLACSPSQQKSCPSTELIFSYL